MDKTTLKDLSIPSTRVKEDNIVLLVIDMQYNITAQGHGVLKYAEELGVREGYDYYYDRIQNVVIPNIQKLLRKFRDIESTIIFTKIRSKHEKNGSESGHVEENGIREGVILKVLEPLRDEIVLTKDGPEIFEDTNLNFLLRNNGIDTLVVAGVLTNECVETAVVEAVKRNYNVILAEDATAAFSADLQEDSLESIGNNSISIASTEDIIEALKRS